MKVYLLFRSGQPIQEFPSVAGKEEHGHTAQRNKTGKAIVSAILGRALAVALDGAVHAIGKTDAGAVLVRSRSLSRGSMQESHYVGSHLAIVNGGEEKITYYAGLVFMAEALLVPESAGDFLNAYADLLKAYLANRANLEKARPQFLLAADELYYWARYRNQPVEEASDRFASLQVVDSGGPLPFTCPKYEVQPRLEGALVDPRVLKAVLSGKRLDPPMTPTGAKTHYKKAAAILAEFAGLQAVQLYEAVTSHENVLLAGPTGSGKTFSVELCGRALGWPAVVIEGKEGLLDLDFFGAYVPADDDPSQRIWKDGPVTRAVRLAQKEHVLLFIDEANRIPRAQLNFLLTLLNQKSPTWCRSQGLKSVPDDLGALHVAEIPMRSETIWCPTVRLRVVLAGNFGRAYGVYDFDPALRRRFPTVLEYNYPDSDTEKKLVVERTGLDEAGAAFLVKLAAETRRKFAGGTLNAPLSTDSLLTWAAKCARLAEDPLTVSSAMTQAGLTWADIVCGRQHTGEVNRGEFNALGDYLAANRMPLGAWAAKPK